MSSKLVVLLLLGLVVLASCAPVREEIRENVVPIETSIDRLDPKSVVNNNEDVKNAKLCDWWSCS